MPARPSNHPQLAVTDAHRRAAFDAMHWTGWTFDDAMADDVRSRLVNLRARQICNAEARALRRHVVYAATTGHVDAVKGAPGQRFWPVHVSDLKRAASGDRDED